MGSAGYGGAVANNEWHWIITLQWQGPHGTNSGTREGLTEPTPEADRQDLFYEAQHNAAQAFGIPSGSDYVVLFFALEPNTLTEA